MYKYFLLFFLSCFLGNAFAIIPPLKGVTPLANFNQLKSVIEKDYSKGYYAEKTALKELMMDKKGFNKTTLETDTVFALTLLGRYTDTQPIYSTQQFQTKLFDGPSPTGTLTQFYNEISYNQLHMTGSCLGWYPVPGNMESYLENNGLSVNGGARFVYELVQTADNSINYANYIQYYDAQNRPHIGFIAAVHTGSDAAAGGHNIWSHRWTFQVYSNSPYITNDVDPVSGQNVIIDGDYAIQPELTGSSNLGGSLIDIGVFAHEFGHIFGLPDLYDTDNSSQGLGEWCLMAGGAYGGSGNNAAYPAHMSVWCKKRMGWLTPVDVTSSLKNVSLINIENNPVAYRIWKQGGAQSKEYFLVENRQSLGFDKDIHGSGLLIYHVDDNRTSNTNENHYWVDLEQADGLRSLNLNAGRGDTGDPFPGSTNNTRFDLGSTPNSNAYTLGSTFVSVRNIKKSNQILIADFDIGTLPYLEIKDIKIEEAVAGNGRVEPGEYANLKFSISNIELANSTTAKFKFTFDDAGVEVLTPEIATPVNGQSASSVTISNAFKISPQFVSKMVYLKYQLEFEGNTISDSIKVVLGIPKVMVITKTDNKDLINYYTSALKNLGYAYEELSNALPEFLSQRDMVIYLTGKSKSNLFTSAEITDIGNYFDAGGKVFFSGQNIAEYLKTAYPSFLNNKVGIDWVQNASVFTRFIYGTTGDIIGNQAAKLRINGNDGAQNELSPDIISSLGNFKISFTYNTAATQGAGGWIENTNGGKMFFLGFGFESINDNESTIKRLQLFQAITALFGVVSAISSNEYIPTVYSLEQNYPNPFNPSTVIKYSLEKETGVRLEVYDITGSQISVLVNKKQAAGNYILEFNAADYNLTSGVYLYKLSAGDFTSVKKMMLLK